MVITDEQLRRLVSSLEDLHGCGCCSMESGIGEILGELIPGLDVSGMDYPTDFRSWTVEEA